MYRVQEKVQCMSEYIVPTHTPIYYIPVVKMNNQIITQNNQIISTSMNID